MRLMNSDIAIPVNIGSDEMVTITELARMIMEIAGKRLDIRYIPGPLGVRGRNSDNNLIYRTLGWRPTQPLRTGLEKTYAWVEKQVGRTSGIVKDRKACIASGCSDAG